MSGGAFCCLLFPLGLLSEDLVNNQDSGGYSGCIFQTQRALHCDTEKRKNSYMICFKGAASEGLRKKAQPG